MSGVVYIITGATASGKTKIALDIAERLNGIIINADSMQIYRDAPILTAQPTDVERTRITHRLYGIADAAHSLSVADWLHHVVQEIHNAWDKSFTPICVGGTGMYIKALLEGIATIPDVSEDVRHAIRQYSTEELYHALQEEDALMAKQLHKNDTQRMARALEVIRATGRSLAAWQKQETYSPLREAKFTVLTTDIERNILYQKINKRYDIMLEKGGMEESQRLYSRQLNAALPLMKAVGIAELMRYHEGKTTLDDAVTLAKRNSRRYAKRQLTWIRNQFPHAQPIEQ